MDPKVKAKWLRALRSGKYKQGDGLLLSKPIGAKVDRYCCLGVLGKCALGLTDDKLRNEELLPDSLAASVGIDQRFLSAVNDGRQTACPPGDGDCFDVKRGWSFKRIANWIEKNL